MVAIEKKSAHEHKITPFLWFDDQAQDAAAFYTSIFRNSWIDGEPDSADSEPRPTDRVTSVSFVLDGQPFIALNGGPVFTFTPAVSFFVRCETQTEVDDLWTRLSAGGKILQCGWLTDKYGVSWQIVPTILGELLADDDEEKADRVMAAMLAMTKLDIAGLQAAARA